MHASLLLLIYFSFVDSIVVPQNITNHLNRIKRKFETYYCMIQSLQCLTTNI